MSTRVRDVERFPQNFRTRFGRGTRFTSGKEARRVPNGVLAAWHLHERGVALMCGPSASQLYHLIGLLEPTSLSPSILAASARGAFSSLPTTPTGEKWHGPRDESETQDQIRQNPSHQDGRENAHLSNSTGRKIKDSANYRPDEISKSLAIESDGIGTVDVAFDEVADGPNWILRSSTKGHGQEIYD
ncbi:uncharacterized protein CIMG_10965 [Coccidioides immitis RS]|uniref:Uncharacterized protein n=3 Tax=Coccidioides immitis TaxID=5501 RepID=A0A0D8JRT5_COCIM|nr:uncharacterized protein CIMG_10965 [Coccidioides immitis RS]KJF60002.1 hypothetical protein CIMG_10965 [Coccidioides immitis RS]KMP10078.1 hypothetical protein CIRG_09311 [Coccidioides immitis RMSCC 2394]KMU86590.1 hypothetical protein CIHG_04378 [Coccidioides immitis H538.4]